MTFADFITQFITSLQALFASFLADLFALLGI